jgi:hypothetical protein
MWSIDDELGRRFWRIWTRSPAAKASPPASRLGYRGAFVRKPGGERVQAFSGLAWQEGIDRLDVRRDPDRRLERLVVGSAPDGMLPPAVRDLTPR